MNDKKLENQFKKTLKITNTFKSWKKQDRDLTSKDIIRFQRKDKIYVYGRCTGGGFGCSITTIGNAIFVENESFNLQETIDKSIHCNARWERYFNIEYLESLL